MMDVTLKKFESHLWESANILRSPLYAPSHIKQYY